MKPLKEHPALSRENRRDVYAPMEDIHRLAINLRHLLSLDPTAVYIEKGNSTVVYYVSPHAKREGVGRIVFAPNGGTRRIDTVGFDPRVV